MSDKPEAPDFQSWLRDHHVTEVECIIADINGIARGKILPGDKFLRSIGDDSLRLPESIFIQTVTGEYPEEDVIDPVDRDIRLRPELKGETEWDIRNGDVPVAKPHSHDHDDHGG